MKLVLICRAHRQAEVRMLDGTITLEDEKGRCVDEVSEQATTINIDEANLYCMTVDGRPHHFMVGQEI